MFRWIFGRFGRFSLAVGNVSGRPQVPLPQPVGPVDRTSPQGPSGDRSPSVQPQDPAETAQLLKDSLTLQRAGKVVDAEDLRVMNDIIERAGHKDFRPTDEDKATIKRIAEKAKAAMSGRVGDTDLGALAHARKRDDLLGSQEVAEAAVKSDRGRFGDLLNRADVKGITRHSFFGLRVFQKNTRALIKTRDKLLGEIAGDQKALAALRPGTAEHTKLKDAIQFKEAQVHVTEKAILKRVQSRSTELINDGASRLETVNKQFAKTFAAQHGKTFTISSGALSALDKLAQVHERFEVRQQVLDDIIRRHQPPVSVRQPVAEQPPIVAPPALPPEVPTPPKPPEPAAPLKPESTLADDMEQHRVEGPDEVELPDIGPEEPAPAPPKPRTVQFTQGDQVYDAVLDSDGNAKVKFKQGDQEFEATVNPHDGTAKAKFMQDGREYEADINLKDGSAKAKFRQGDTEYAASVNLRDGSASVKFKQGPEEYDAAVNLAAGTASAKFKQGDTEYAADVNLKDGAASFAFKQGDDAYAAGINLKTGAATVKFKQGDNEFDGAVNLRTGTVAATFTQGDREYSAAVDLKKGTASAAFKQGDDEYSADVNLRTGAATVKFKQGDTEVDGGVNLQTGDVAVKLTANDEEYDAKINLKDKSVAITIDVDGEDQTAKVNLALDADGKVTATATAKVGDTEVTLTSGKEKGKLSATTKFSTGGWDVAVGAAITWENRNEVLDGDTRTKHVRAKGVSASASASGPVTLGLGAGASVNTVFLRTVRPDETAEGVLESVTPPTSEDFITGPAKALALPGDTSIFSSRFQLSATVGYADPSGFKVSASASYTREFRVGIQRLKDADGNPVFRMRVEPETSGFTGDVSVGWGPFSVKGGGGRAQSVYYEFDMSESAVQDFMRTKTLPVIPDPKQYLEGGKKFTPDAFTVFDKVNGNGVKLVSFGAAKEVELHGSVSASAATVGGRIARHKKIFLREDGGLREVGRTQTTSTEVWFRGKREQEIRHVHSYNYTLSEDKQSIVRTYGGVSAGFKLSDTSTTRANLEERVALVNGLLGRDFANKLTLPQDDLDFGTTAASVTVDLKPEHINTLAGLSTRDPATELNVRAIAFSAKLAPDAFVKLVDDLQPDAIRRANPRAFESSVLLSKNMTEAEQLLALRGKVLATFVDAHGVKGIAALDRLLGGNVAQFTLTSNVYDKQLQELGVAKLKPDLDEPWKSFATVAEKQKALADLKASVSANENNVLTTDEKAKVLADVERQSRTLEGHMAKLLEDPARRGAIMENLVQAGDKFGTPEVIGGYLDRVIAAAGTDQRELTGLLDKLLDGKGRIGVPQVIAILEKARTNKTLADMMALIGDEKMQKLIGRLHDDEKQKLVEQFIVSDDWAKKEAVMVGTEVSSVEIWKQVEALHGELKTLTGRLPRQQSMTDKEGYPLVDLYKPFMRDLTAAREIEAKINANPRLTRQHKAMLLQMCGTVQKVLASRVEGMKNDLTPDQRKDLFEHLMSPRFLREYTGRASHALMKQLVEGDRLAPEQLKEYITPLVGKIAAEGGQIVNILKLVKDASPSALRGALDKLSLEQIRELGNHPEVDQNELLGLAIAAGDPDKAGALRKLNESYRMINTGLTVIQSVKREMEAAPLDGIDYFKRAVAFDRGLTDTRAQLLSFERDGRLTTDHAAPLQTSLAALEGDARTAMARLAALPRPWREALLAQVVGASDADAKRLAAKLIGIAQAAGDLSSATGILFKDAGTHAETLLGVIKEMHPDAQRALFAGTSLKKLKAMATALDSRQQKELITLMRNADSPHAEEIRKLAPGYADAATKLIAHAGAWNTAIQDYPQLDISRMTPADQVSHLKAYVRVLQDVREREATLKELGEPYLQPHSDTIRLMRVELERRSLPLLGALNDDQSVALFTALKSSTVGSATRELLDALIANAREKPALLKRYADHLKGSTMSDVHGQMFSLLKQMAPTDATRVLKDMTPGTISSHLENLADVLPEDQVRELKALADRSADPKAISQVEARMRKRRIAP